MKRQLIIMAAVIMLSGGLTACSEIRHWLGRPEIYQARVTLLAMGSITAPYPDHSDPGASVLFAQECAALAVSAEVLEAAREAGNFPETPEVRAHVIENTSLLVLTVSNKDPDLAVAMANEVAHQVVLRTSSNLTPEQQAQLDTAAEEMDRLRQELEGLHSQRDDIERKLAAATAPDEITDLKDRLDRIDDQIELVTSSIAQFADTIVSLRQGTNPVEIVEPALLIGSSD